MLTKTKIAIAPFLKILRSVQSILKRKNKNSLLSYSITVLIKIRKQYILKLKPTPRFFFNTLLLLDILSKKNSRFLECVDLNKIKLFLVCYHIIIGGLANIQNGRRKNRGRENKHRWHIRSNRCSKRNETNNRLRNCIIKYLIVMLKDKTI